MDVGVEVSSVPLSRQGSLKELETQTILARRLDYATAAQADGILSESEVVGKMLGSLIRSLKPKAD